MTVEEIIQAALARCAEFSDKVPNSKTVDLSRVNQAQEQLFSRIASINPDYTGRDDTLTLAGGSASAVGLDPLPMRIWYVEIANVGTSPYTSGQRVNLVPVDDQLSDLAPRATFRDDIFAQVGTDLALVTSIKVFYARRPTTLAALGATPDLPAQFHELLVIDLAKAKVRKMFGLDQTSRKEIFDLLALEEEDLLKEFDEHLRNYNSAETTRFGRTAGPR